MQELEKQERINGYEAEDKLFNFRPIFFFAVFVCLGIAFAAAYAEREFSLWWAAVILPVVSLPVLFRRKGKRLLALLAASGMVLAFCLGFLGLSTQIRRFEDAKAYGEDFTVVGRVIERVEKNGRCVLVLDGIQIEGKAERSKLVAYLPAVFYDNIALSDEVRLKGYLQTDAKAFDENGMRAVEIYDDLRFVVNVSTVEDCTVKGHTFDVFLEIRQRVQTVLTAGMDETTAAVTLAVLMGDTTLMGEELLQNMRYGGIAHVFAVSGLHIGALYAFCLLLIGKTPLWKTPKTVRFVFVGVILLFYGGVCGYSASVVRAIVTCLAFYFGKLTGFSSDRLENLGLAAIVVLFLSPVSLFTVGFQLSFAACLGIILLNRPIYRICENVSEGVVCAITRRTREERARDREERPPTLRERVARSCFSFLSVTLSAQIATAPLHLWIFGYVSIWSLLLNCAFVPIVSAAFSLVLSFAAVACVFPVSISGAILYVPSVMWSALLLVFQTLDFSSGLINGITLTGEMLVCYYGACLFATDKWNVSGKLKTAFVLLFALAFVVFLSALHI